MRARSIRRLAGVTTTAVLLGSAMLATAGGVQAAPPNWVMHVEALPGTVQGGAAAGYQVTITNNGPSNISALYLTTKVGDNNGVSPVYVDDGVATGGPCTDPGVPLHCSFGALNDDQSVTVTVAYTATGSSSFDPGFQGNTTGKTYTDPKRSHGDTLEDTTFTGTALRSDKNFNGRFNLTDGTSISTDPQLTGNNKQSTKLPSLPANAAATVEDGPNANPLTACITTSTIDCSKLVGEWSNVHLGSGTFSAPITIQISFKTVTPTAFVHVKDDGTQEPVGQCSGNVAPTSNSQLPCFTWSGDTATIYTLNNGSWRGL